MMHYNESSAPTYSRNPLSCKNINGSASSLNKDLLSLNQSFQTGHKSRADPTASRDSIDEIFQTSIANKIQSNFAKPAPKEKQQHLSSKELKIRRLRHEINNDQNLDVPHHSKSHNADQSRRKEIKGSRKSKYATLKTQGEESFGQFSAEASMFSPKILNRSKSMVRKVDISTLLFQDARRRQEKMQFKVESSRQQKQLLASPKINSNTNALVLNKIRQEFKQLVTEEDLNPLIALSVLEQIFNVNLNPHRQAPNYESVQRLIGILTENNSGGEAKSKRLWQFICWLILGDVESGEESLFTHEEESQIRENFQYLYKERMTKERKSPSPDRLTFRPKTLESSSKLANSFREKTCQKLDEFVQNQKITVNIKDGNYTIEDLFIIEHHKKLAQNQRKKLERQNQELQKCTFKPNLSPSASSFKVIKQKPKIPLRTSKAQFLKSQHTWNNSSEFQLSRNVSKIVPAKTREERQRIRKSRQGRISTLADEIRNAEKVILRMSVGRQTRQFSNQLKERGYPRDQNWNQMQRSMHRESIDNSKKLKGLKSQ